MSTIEAEKLKIDKRACNLTELIHELADIFHLTLAEKNINLVLNIDPAMPAFLLLDKARLRQVLLNIIGNAIKLTEKGSIKIELQAASINKFQGKLDLHISVTDSGLGISEEQQQLIFQKFEQSSDQDSRKYGSTGLGLSISKRLVEMMGGSLSLTSQQGHGSKFTTTLLGVDIATLVPTTTENKNKDIAEKNFITFLPASVLVVDDIEDNREF